MQASVANAFVNELFKGHNKFEYKIFEYSIS